MNNTEGKRLSIISPMSLRKFINVVKYDPANPPLDDYESLGMMEAHNKTQSDFKGAKKTNRLDFINYLQEGVREERDIHLPVISGWQSSDVFSDAIFVIYHQVDAHTAYGCLYLPRKPIMQSDGQTQTAALFGVAQSKEGVEAGALDKLIVTLEIELNVDSVKAAQAFADRNGRGSKKNKNLVISMDTAAPLSRLRSNIVQGTVFERRIADGRSGGITVTSTENIVDLSTFEQMLAIALTGGSPLKPEKFKSYHMDTLMPFAVEFIQLLDATFKSYWVSPVLPGKDPYRRLYVMGWPFALKGIALAYYNSRIDKLEPIRTAMQEKVPANEIAQEYFERIISSISVPVVKVSFEELSIRLNQINWLKHKKHWIAITGYAESADGSKKEWKLKEYGTVVKSLNQNQAVLVTKVANKILSPTWEDLKSDIDEPLS
ncbi:hypothetical protein [Photobacterium sp. Ph6]|nr:hypothetical protein [Photobacterium sp. Ph6]